jgi:hypothetical protein
MVSRASGQFLRRSSPSHYKQQAIALFFALFAIGGCQSGTSVSDVNEASKRLENELESYLALSNTEPPLDTPSQAEAFFDEGDRRIASLRDAYENWASLLENSIAEGNAPSNQDPEDVRAYEEAVDDWISAQEEQSRLSRQCFSSREVSNEAATRCYLELISRYGPAWQATADRLNELAKTAK